MNMKKSDTHLRLNMKVEDEQMATERALLQNNNLTAITQPQKLTIETPRGTEYSSIKKKSILKN